MVMQNSMVMFTVYVFDHKYLSWTNLVQKFKIIYSDLFQKSKLFMEGKILNLQ